MYYYHIIISMTTMLYRFACEYQYYGNTLQRTAAAFGDKTNVHNWLTGWLARWQAVADGQVNLNNVFCTPG